MFLRYFLSVADIHFLLCGHITKCEYPFRSASIHWTAVDIVAYQWISATSWLQASDISSEFYNSTEQLNLSKVIKSTVQVINHPGIRRQTHQVQFSRLQWMWIRTNIYYEQELTLQAKTIFKNQLITSALNNIKFLLLHITWASIFNDLNFSFYLPSDVRSSTYLHKYIE